MNQHQHQQTLDEMHCDDAYSASAAPSDPPADSAASAGHAPPALAPVFVPDFSNPPTRIATSGPLIPSVLPSKIPTRNNYTRQVAWSTNPAASYLASMHNDRSVRLWPSAAFLASPETTTPAHYSMAESITDMAWSPSPDQLMLAVSCPSQPIHLISPSPAGPPTRLATYAAPTHLDVLLGATSLSFDPYSATRLVAGYPHAALHAFDLTRPASPTTSSSPANKLKGILSSLVHLPHFSSLAVSSYSSLLTLLDANSLTCTHTIRGLPPATCLAVDPGSSTYLVSSHRNGLVACHDVRDVRGPVWTRMRATACNMRTSVQVLDSAWVVVGGSGPRASQVHAVDLATGTMEQVVVDGGNEVVAACSVVGGGRWWATGQGSRRYVVESLGEDEGERDNSVNVWEVSGGWMQM